MMTSTDDSDDDLHQCGRCKQLFRGLFEYMFHKKSKSCVKLDLSKHKSRSASDAASDENRVQSDVLSVVLDGRIAVDGSNPKSIENDIVYHSQETHDITESDNAYRVRISEKKSAALATSFFETHRHVEKLPSSVKIDNIQEQVSNNEELGNAKRNCLIDNANDVHEADYETSSATTAYLHEAGNVSSCTCVKRGNNGDSCSEISENIEKIISAKHTERTKVNCSVAAGPTLNEASAVYVSSAVAIILEERCETESFIDSSQALKVKEKDRPTDLKALHAKESNHDEENSDAEDIVDNFSVILDSDTQTKDSYLRERENIAICQIEINEALAGKHMLIANPAVLAVVDGPLDSMEDTSLLCGLDEPVTFASTNEQGETVVVLGLMKTDDIEPRVSITTNSEFKLPLSNLPLPEQQNTFPVPASLAAHKSSEPPRLERIEASDCNHVKLKRGRPPKSNTYNKIIRLKKPACHPLTKPPTQNCPKCSYVSRSEDDYDRHLRKLHNLSTYVCPHCQSAFSDKYKLKRHVKKQCNPVDVAATAKAPEFTQLAKKLRYSAEHSTEGDADDMRLGQRSSFVAYFRCHLCEKLCMSYEEILRHVKEHPPASPGICRFCGGWFANKYKLRRHVTSSVHDDVSDEQLQLFKTQVETMKIVYPVNVRRPTSTVVFLACRHCNQTFTDRFSLRKHKKTKHGRLRSVRLLLCKFCPASFYRNSEYVSHLVTAHNISDCNSSLIARQCPVCCRQFQHRSNVARHQLTLHVALQQVPVLRCSTMLSDTEVLQCSTPRQNSQNKRDKTLSCFVCCKMIASGAEFKEHIECHRVWVSHQEFGSIETDLVADKNVSDVMLPSINNSRPTSDIDEINARADILTQKDGFCTSAPSNLPNIVMVEKTFMSNDLSLMKIANDKSALHSESHPCLYCSLVCFDIESLYEHKVMEHKLIPVFRCVLQTCGATFNLASDYMKHSMIHSQKSFICRTCNDHFDSIDVLVAHRLAAHKHSSSFIICKIIQTQPVQQKLDENIVPKLTKVKRSRVKKSTSFTHKKPIIILCDQCGETFPTKAELCRHRSMHVAVRRHKCRQCGKLFNKNEHLQRHLVSRHSSAKPHVCAVEGCGKAFKRKDKLTEHQKCHSGVKQHACSVCGRRYRYREGLLYHERTHEQEQRYRCAHCAIRFSRPSELKLHMTSAHGVDNKKELYAYRCHICRQLFSRPERVKRHVERDHSVMAAWCYRCEHCSKGFAGVKSYKTHLERNHSGPDHSGANSGVRLTRQRKSKLSQAHPVAVEPAARVLSTWNEGPAITVPTLEESNASSEMEEQASEAENVSSFDIAYYSASLSKSREYQPSSVRPSIDPLSSELGTAYVAPSVGCISAETPLNSQLNLREIVDAQHSYDDPNRSVTTANYCSAAYPANPPESSEESNYPTMSELEMDIGDTERISPVTFSANNVAPTSYSYASYSSSAINQPTSSLYPSIGLYHSSYSGMNRSAGISSGFNTDHAGNSAAPSFSFTRANTFASADGRAKPADIGVAQGQMPSVDYTVTPFRPVAMPTQGNPPAHPYPSGHHPYATHSSHIGRWFPNMSLLNPLDAAGKQSMLDHFSRLPTERTAMSRTFSMARRDAYMGAYAHPVGERRMFDTCGQPSATSDQRHALIDYNFATAADSHTRTMRRDEHFVGAGSGLHQMAPPPPGAMSTMHMPLPLLAPPPHPPPPTHQQQQFPPVGDYQWPTMPMYNWL